ELDSGGVGARREAALDRLQRDRRPRSTTRSLRHHVAELALQPNPPLHRCFADIEQLGELWIAALARLVGGDDAFSERDWVTVNHAPTRSEADPRFKRHG